MNVLLQVPPVRHASKGALTLTLMMILSLSVRVAESFLSKEQPSASLETLAELAAGAGYQAICMRASQVGVQSPRAAVQEAAGILSRHGLQVSMVTGDFDTVYNNAAGPQSLRRIQPYLDLAQALRAPLIRVALKTEEDIAWAQRAADAAAERGLRLVHQSHTQSLFETVDGIEQTLQRIGRPNFGLIFEPANLELCGQDYGPPTLARLAPWIFNVYLQNQALNPHGSQTLVTWCRGPVSFDLLPIGDAAGIDFLRVSQGLAAIGYRGPVTMHQAQTPETPMVQAIRQSATYWIDLSRRSGLARPGMAC